MKFYIIGIDDSQSPCFSENIQDILSNEVVFSGGKRHYQIVQSFLPHSYQWIDVTIPLESVFQEYKQHSSIVVFASGDPLFFGLANTIKREFPNADIALYPYFNSLQLLAHRLVLPYHDMHIVSLTGRPWDKFDEALIRGYKKIGVLTDRKIHTPANIVKHMIEYGYDNYKVTVGELLGNDKREKVTTFECLNDVVNRDFSYPNNLILEQTTHRVKPFGIPNEDFYLLNSRTRMITKMPIRLLSLSLLDLHQKHTFWDVGFCTGSVSIEAKLQFPHLKVVAFEKREEGRALIVRNAKKIGTPGIEYHIGDFTQKDLSNLTAPDAVFIGGHGGKMMEIIAQIQPLLKPQGVIVFNSVSLESQQLFRDAIHKYKLTLMESISIQIDNFNTIEVMKAIKTH